MRIWTLGNDCSLRWAPFKGEREVVTHFAGTPHQGDQVRLGAKVMGDVVPLPATLRPFSIQAYAVVKLRRAPEKLGLCLQ